jgi:hypothetical protein
MLMMRGAGRVRKEYKILLEKSQQKNDVVCLPAVDIRNDLCERLATPVIVGWFAGRTWKSNSSSITNCLKYDRRSHNTSWRAADWKPMVWTEFMSV